ncbi:transposase [Sorangium sp. So ce726]|uniref:transposase n=2 Tax=Sorangium TaxID=39643 RepID=UPI003F6280ED
MCFRRLGTRAAPHVVAPQWLRGLSSYCPSALAYDKPLCAALDGFTLHAATRAGAHHAAAREARLRYVLRPPIANERVEPQQDGLVRLSLKRAFADGTVAVDMDPLSLLCRLAASVPPPRFHTVKYAGVLASASRPRWRAIASDRALLSHKSLRRRTKAPLRNASVAAIERSINRAELLRRTFAIHVLERPACKGWMKLVAMVTEPRNIARFLSALGEPTDVPARSPNRGPPYWKSTVVRRKAPGDAA